MAIKKMLKQNDKLSGALQTKDRQILGLYDRINSTEASLKEAKANIANTQSQKKLQIVKLKKSVLTPGLKTLDLQNINESPTKEVVPLRNPSPPKTMRK